MDMTDARSPESDLAFLKALVEEGSRSQMTGGAAFLAGGLLYGFQCLVQWAQAVGLVHLSDGFMLAFVIGITVTFLIVLGIVLWRERGLGQRAASMRALNAAFAGAGIANLVLCSVFALVALRERSQTIWLLYPVTLSVVFGAAWYVAFMVRRRAWHGLVSAGWYATAVGLGVLVSTGDVATYVLAIAVALLVLMALPGAVMMRAAVKSN
jgi:hypothetical protein